MSRKKADVEEMLLAVEAVSDVKEEEAVVPSTEASVEEEPEERSTDTERVGFVEEPIAESDALAIEPDAIAKITAMLESEQAKLINERCINCGQSNQPLGKLRDTFYCPGCQHRWTEEEEQTPFRRVQRGK